ncbi:MAG: YqaE/Pmp3 family membrane protein [Prosthecochloris sp.]|uniref:YqaE/Pmp3 family membrane protein n=1 Tax=Prosthecochloris sp. TaxID=290513 RepID=UPI0013CC6686|nr:YqaE/Pmp3 family membrane protein [Prosthecochloris sp.]NEX11230.1 YqaE/Pmp3 family membrane protein [Prosthecochloris sp.]
MLDVRKWIFAIICPPAAVLNKEVGTIMLVGLLTAMFWVPGVIAALFLLIRDQLRTGEQQPQV